MTLHMRSCDLVFIGVLAEDWAVLFVSPVPLASRKIFLILFLTCRFCLAGKVGKLRQKLERTLREACDSGAERAFDCGVPTPTSRSLCLISRLDHSVSLLGSTRLLLL